MGQFIGRYNCSAYTKYTQSKGFSASSVKFFWYFFNHDFNSAEVENQSYFIGQILGRNAYRNIKSETSQDFAQKPQRNCTFINSASSAPFALTDGNAQYNGKRTKEIETKKKLRDR